MIGRNNDPGRPPRLELKGSSSSIPYVGRGCASIGYKVVGCGVAGDEVTAQNKILLCGQGEGEYRVQIAAPRQTPRAGLPAAGLSPRRHSH